MMNFNKAWVEAADEQVPGGWAWFIKKTPTRMLRIDGPFTVETSEGPLTCQDGWLAVDARGYPYPLDDEEKNLIYKEVVDCDHCSCYQPCCDCGEMAF